MRSIVASRPCALPVWQPPPPGHAASGSPKLDAPACTAWRINLAAAQLGAPPPAPRRRLRGSRRRRARPSVACRCGAAAGRARAQAWAVCSLQAGRLAARRTHHGALASCSGPPAAPQRGCSPASSTACSRDARARCMPPTRAPGVRSCTGRCRLPALPLPPPSVVALDPGCSRAPPSDRLARRRRRAAHPPPPPPAARLPLSPPARRTATRPP